MQINEYINNIENHARIVFKEETIHDYINQKLSQGDKQFQELVVFRQDLITEYELEYANHFRYLFEIQNDDIAKGCFGVLLDLAREIEKIDIKRLCNPYKKTQTLFQAYPSLFNCVKNDELLDYRCLKQMSASEIFQVNEHFVRLGPMIPPQFLDWVSRTYPNSKLYVKINADSVFSSRPPMMVFEEILLPPNPDWIKDLRIYKNSVENAAFILQEPTRNHSTQYFWDYKFRNIRRLEISAKRFNNGNLRFILEEVPKIDNEKRYFSSFCIHLDTDDPIGTTFNNSTLNHIDLALNFYENESMHKRFNQSLTNGKVINASMRTHLIRIENVPLKVLINMAFSCLQSKTLVNEWIENQFKNLNA